MTRPRAAPQMTSSGLWAPTYTRVMATSTTTTQGTTFQRPGRYGVMRPAIAVTNTAWPETKLSPKRLTSPRSSTSGPIDVAGRRRVTTALTARSRTSLATVATSSSRASRNRRKHAATSAAIGPTTSTPSCWNGHSTG